MQTGADGEAMRTLLLALCLLLALPGEAMTAQPVNKARGRPKAAAKASEQPPLSAQELLNPYSAAASDNATRWQFDPEPKGLPFGHADDKTPVSLRLGREDLRDPLTQKELSPRADPLKAKDSLKNMDIKDAFDKAGGKAEVQVEILKF